MTQLIPFRRNLPVKNQNTNSESKWEVVPTESYADKPQQNLQLHQENHVHHHYYAPPAAEPQEEGPGILRQIWNAWCTVWVAIFAATFIGWLITKC